MEPILQTKKLDLRYGAFQALYGIDTDIFPNEITALIGPSGCGKSMTLKCIAGIVTPDRGRIVLGGRVLFDSEKKINLPPQQRRVGYLFQQYALFPNMSVEQNILCGIRSGDKAEKRRVLAEKIRMFRLEGLEKKHPAQLSGGQQQRIAIARALATNPKVLLCDEATSALDPKTTRQILELIQDINRKLGITVVVITHQMSVVKEICTHVAILDDGEVVEDGLVSAVFSAPKSQAARHLVFPGGADAAVSDPSQERRIRLIFRSAQTTAIPMVARLAAEESIYANVISASTQKLSEEVYGSMLLGIPNSQFDRAWQFFRTIPNLQAEEVSVDVQ